MISNSSSRRWRFDFSIVILLLLLTDSLTNLSTAAATPKRAAADTTVPDSIASATSPSQKTSATAPASMSASSSSTSAGKPRKTRQQNFYNYRTNYEDDRNYAYFEGDTAGNYVSDFGLRTNRPSARVSNPFEIFGQGRSSSSSNGYSDSGRSRSRYDEPDDDYLFMDNGGEGVLDDAVGGVADDYDDYQDPQQYLDDPPPVPVAEGRRYDGGGRRTRIRIRPTLSTIANGAGWSGNTHLTTSRGPSDASYSFGYSTADQSRYEYSDQFGNVVGYYEYIDDDGILRHVSYTAGAGTGFVVNQNRLSTGWGHRIRPTIPVSPTIPPRVKVTVGGGASGGWAGAVGEEEEDIYSQGHRIPQSHQQPASGWQPPRRRKPSVVVKIRRPVKPEPPAWIYYRPPNPGRPAPGGWRRPTTPTRRPVTSRPKVYPDEDLGNNGGWIPDTDHDSRYPKDASYHFAYDAGDHDRNEYSDPWGNVRGSYSYIDPSGIRRTVHYSAGSTSGFKILSASPSQIVQRVYKGIGKLPGLPGPIGKIRPKPSAYVYHLHPDSGWKPWEGSETNIIDGGQRQRQRPRTRPLKSNQVATSYQYQSFGKADDEAEVSAEDSNVNDAAVSSQPVALNTRPPPSTNDDVQEKPIRHRNGGSGGGWNGRSGSRHRASHQQQQQQQPQLHQYHREVNQAPPPKDDGVEQIYEQEYADDQLSDDEYQIVAGTKYEPQKNNNENGKILIQGYKGGYGDKNPLLVMSESSARPRESSNSMKDGQQASNSGSDGDNRRSASMMMSQSGGGSQSQNDYEPTTSRPISVARMMSMRMSKSKKMMKMMKNKSSMAMVKSINEASSNMRRRNGKMEPSTSTGSGSSSNTRHMHVSHMNNVRGSMLDHHSSSSVSQSQSFQNEGDEDEVVPQPAPLRLSRQMSIMGPDRRLAHYPKSQFSNGNGNGLDDELNVHSYNGRMMLLVPMPVHMRPGPSMSSSRPAMHYPLLY